MGKKNKLFAGMQKSMHKIDEQIKSKQTMIEEISIDKIDPNPYQPRKYFNEEKLKELADNIKKEGLDQPITVNYINGRYTLIVGERRLKASKIAELTKIKAIIVKYDSALMQKKALWENILREDLSSYEIYMAISNIMKMENIKTIKELSDLINMSYAQTRSLLSFSKLSEEFINKYNSLTIPLPIQIIERLTSVKSNSNIMEYMEYIINNNLSRVNALKYISKMESNSLSTKKTEKISHDYVAKFSKVKFELKINRNALSSEIDTEIEKKLLEIEQLLKSNKV